jgi:C4-dicarboxylate-binding protein DctP
MQGGFLNRSWRCCLLLACLALVPFAAGAEQIKLRVTLQLPITNHLGVNLTQFKTEVEKQSGGTIQVEIFDNSRLYRDDQAVEAVSSGAIEMGSIGFSQFVARAPALELFTQPFLLNFEALVRAATDPDREVRKVLDNAVLDRFGVRILWLQSFGSSVFVSKGRDARTPAGIHGQRVRIWAANMAKFTKDCGGTPLVVSASKQLQAFKDGTVDMLTTGIASIESRGLWKELDTVTRTEHAALEFAVVINEKVWQSLRDDRKAIIVAAGKKVERELRQRMADVEARAFAFARSKGMKVYDLTPNEVAEWRACSADVMAEYMSKAGDTARRLMEAYGKLRTDPCCSSGPKGEFTAR